MSEMLEKARKYEDEQGKQIKDAGSGRPESLCGLSYSGAWP